MSNPVSDYQPTPKAGLPKKLKHTLIWDRADWEDAHEAARRLSLESGAYVSVPNYVRGAIQLRNRQVLGEAA